MSIGREIEDIARDLIKHQHDHPPVRDLNREFDRKLKLTDRIASDFARLVGSWVFVLAQLGLMVLWVLLVIAAGVALYVLLRPLLARSEGTIGPDVSPPAAPAPPASSVRDIAAPPTNEPAPRRDAGDPAGGKPKVK